MLTPRALLVFFFLLFPRGLGSSQAALEILLAAANIEAEALGQEHPETRQTYGNISLAYASLGDATNAEKYRRLQGKA